MIPYPIGYCSVRTLEASDKLQLTSIIPHQQPDHGSDQHNFEPCLNCGNTRINLVRMPQHSTHYAARRCAECDSFRSWEPKPATQQKLQHQETISQLLKFPQLTQWEKTFLEELKGKKLSPKQQEVLTRIKTKVEGDI